MGLHNCSGELGKDGILIEVVANLLPFVEDTVKFRWQIRVTVNRSCK